MLTAYTVFALVGTGIAVLVGWQARVLRKQLEAADRGTKD